MAGHNQKYDASKQDSSYIRDDASPNEIVVSGLMFDVIKNVSQVDLNFTPDAGTLQSDPERIDRVLQYFSSAMALAHAECTDPYQPLTASRRMPLDEAVSRTMIGDAVELQQPIIWGYPNLVPRFLEYGQIMKQALEQRDLKFDNPYPLSQGHRAYKLGSEEELQIRQLMKDVEKARWLCGGQETRRKFAVTGKGCIGMVPRKARVGDLICILYGSAVPMVLRKMPSEDTYQLVGETYVHGIMDGEGLSTRVKMEFHLL